VLGRELSNSSNFATAPASPGSLLANPSRVKASSIALRAKMDETPVPPEITVGEGGGSERR
jgi:hypothetical protein